MVFKAKGAQTYKLRVDHPDGRHATLSTGCRDEEDARDVEAIVDRWRGKKGKKYARPDVLDALIEKRVTLRDAVEAYNDAELEELLAAHPPIGIDLAPEIDAWIADKKKGKGAGQADTYEKQLRVLFPGATLPLSLFTRREVWARLDALKVETPTKNRYRAAVSSFAKYLVKREVIDRNFVRDIEGFGENDPRLVYYEIDDARRLIAAMPQPYAAMSALAVGFCMEWTALDQAIVSDLALDATPIVARVRGTKRSTRARFVPLVPELRWTLDYIRPALEEKLPTAPILDGITEWRAIDVQRAAAKALKITAVGEDDFGPHSIHDWRQTHGVALLRWGYSEQIVADHEGHIDTTMVRRKYGRFRPSTHDYAKGESSTNSATSLKTHRPKRA